MELFNTTENINVNNTYFNYTEFNTIYDAYYNCSDNKTNMVCYSDKDIGFNIFNIWSFGIMMYIIVYREKQLFGVNNLFVKLYIISLLNLLIKLCLVSLINGYVADDDINYIMKHTMYECIILLIITVLISILAVFICIVVGVIVFICIIISQIVDKLFNTNFTNQITKFVGQITGKKPETIETNNDATEEEIVEEETVEVRRSPRIAEKNKTE